MPRPPALLALCVLCALTALPGVAGAEPPSHGPSLGLASLMHLASGSQPWEALARMGGSL